MMKITKIVTKKAAQTDNKEPEPLNFPEIKSIKDDDSFKSEMDRKCTQERRILPYRARKVPLRFEEEFNTDFSVRLAKPKKCKERK